MIQQEQTYEEKHVQEKKSKDNLLYTNGKIVYIILLYSGSPVIPASNYNLGSVFVS